jgi:hypothetical protein
VRAVLAGVPGGQHRTYRYGITENVKRQIFAEQSPMEDREKIAHANPERLLKL